MIPKELTEKDVIRILRHPENHNWTIQGFGMLRTWIDPEGIQRLHIWDPNMTYDNTPSTVHTHPWDFSSRIYFGDLRNERHTISTGLEGITHQWAEILTGQGGGLISKQETILLVASEPEIYHPGDIYSQEAPEIHESYPERGTVTVITRNFRFERHAAVYWSANAKWVTAEPREATEAEIQHFIHLARRNMT